MPLILRDEVSCPFPWLTKEEEWRNYLHGCGRGEEELSRAYFEKHEHFQLFPYIPHFRSFQVKDYCWPPVALGMDKNYQMLNQAKVVALEHQMAQKIQQNRADQEVLKCQGDMKVQRNAAVLRN